MPFAAAFSEHPVPTQAVGEVVGQVLENLGEGPDLAALFVTAPHTGALEDIAAAVHKLLRPGCLIGATAVGVAGAGRGVEDTPGITLWAGRLPQGTVTPVRLTAEQTPSGWVVDGLDAEAASKARSLLLLADPFTFPAVDFLADLRVSHPGLAVIGGMASAARGPGGNRLVPDGRLVNHGAIGVLLDADVSPDAVVSQGCRPIGQPFTVTKSERSIIYELGGRPALERLMETIDALNPDDKALAARGLHCGIVVDEQREDYERGDFLIRGVVGADRSIGAVAIGDEVAVGSIIQFQVRDAASAEEDLVELLAGRQADGALLFTCNGRGTTMFETADHDPQLVHDLLGQPALSGMFCAGELGPIAGRNALHGFTASVALFKD